MTGRLIVDNYCRALVGLAAEKHDITTIKQIAMAMLPVMKLPEVSQFLNYPLVSPADKKEFVVNLFPADTPQELINFFHLIIDRRHTRLFSEILDRIIDLAMKEQGFEVVTLITARELSESEEVSILQNLERRWKTKLYLKKRHNPNLIGGIVIQREDVLYDGSILGQIKSLRRKLTAPSV
jgi:F-type H+-transporting ATPase subunit delta